MKPTTPISASVRRRTFPGRSAPLAATAAARRGGSAGVISWIAMSLGRELVWDAKAERFVTDDEANAALSRPERAPFGANRPAKT